MEKEKKIWFIGKTRRIWIPVSIEGWIAITTPFILLFSLIKLQELDLKENSSLHDHWYFLVEMLIVTIIFYIVTRGHVDKRY